MALPLNSTPVYTLTVPSTGKKLKFRPFLIKEEKTLLIAQQSEDTAVMVESLKEVIQSCIKDEVDVNALATFDLEYIFTQIRSKSVGEIIELMMLCDTCTDDKAVAKVSIDLTKLQVEKNPEHKAKIHLYQDVGIVMKYPTLDILKKMENVNTNDLDEVFNIIVDCIDYIYNTEEVFQAKEQTNQELLDFLNNLSSDQFAEVQKFFETMPKLKHEIDYVCPVCSKEHHKVLEGLNSFF
jgi:hypothetical protein